MTTALASPQQVLDTWFGPDPQTVHDEWFKVDPAFDTLLHTRFEPTVQAALQGGLQDWEGTRPGRQALVLVLDQFTRNLYRHQAAAFAGDARALALCHRMLAAGDDQALPVLQRWFVYMPLMHAEDRAAQNLSVRLFTTLAAEDARLASALDYARRHRDVILRFGRYPHRNDALGRASSDEEQAFLRQPGARF